MARQQFRMRTPQRRAHLPFKTIHDSLTRDNIGEGIGGGTPTAGK